jgi:uncharacterized protein YbcC (UPF0753/DUF2309 family)
MHAAHHDPGDLRGHLAHVLAHIGHLLPDQGPIGVFVHHNTLHAFQHLPFHEAIAASSAVFGTRGYLEEASYRNHFREGRIRRVDVEAALLARWSDAEPAAGEALQRSGRDIERATMFHPIAAESASALTWLVEENDARRRLRPDLEARSAQRLVAATRTAFEAILAEIGVSRTFAEVAEIIAGAPVAALEHAVRAPAPRRLFARSVQHHLGVLGLAGQEAARYLSFVTERVGASAARWIEVEADLVMPAVARLYSRTGSVADLRALAAREPERVAASWLWSVARSTPPRPGPAGAETMSHPTALIRALCGEDTDDLVHPAMIRWSAAYLDEGQSHWPMPGRQSGFFRAWLDHVGASPTPVPPWLGDLKARTASLAGLDATEAVLRVLDELGLPPDRWEAFLTALERSLPGWAGMMHRLERIPSDQLPGSPPASLVDFLAVRLQYDVLAWQWVARRSLDHGGPVGALLPHLERLPRPRPAPPHALSDAWVLFQMAQVLEITPDVLGAAPLEARRWILDRVSGFDAPARARVWQEAYERGYRDGVLAGLAANRARRQAWLSRDGERPSAQVLFCIDDREEAIRRHLEEHHPSVETFGVAGFFGVAMDFCGLDDFQAAPLCPVVVTPGHHVDEVAAVGHERSAVARAQRRSMLARALLAFNRRSRGLLSATAISIAGGVFAAFPFAARVFAPRWVGRFKRTMSERLVPVPKTVFTGLAEGSVNERGRQVGFTFAEQATRVGSTLENLGLTRTFAPAVVLMGHGSVSVNNPHQSAYDCGACGGRHGGPNARLFAEMANNPEVRRILAAERNIHIPDSTRFYGAMHNTCTDAIEVYDVPAEVVDQPAWRALNDALEHARRMSAHERCRRFASAPRDPSPEEALAHVEERSEDLSQARPELGHVTNAACVVGRRSLTRGLFLDRRAFLVSYDPEIDPAGAIIERILTAVGPVGAGINLEYYFSCVDNLRLGCGTKLPHNLTSLLGVMDGAMSDLRTGLPRQMIEIHEPIRLLLVCEASPETLVGVVQRQPIVAELVVNEWVQVVSVHPTTGEITRFVPGHGFLPWEPGAEDAPATAKRSTDWYRGHEGFLPPALILAASGRPDGYQQQAVAR